MFNSVHQLGLIRDYTDYLAAKQDIEALLVRGFDVEMTDEEFDYIRATRRHIELFESYLELDRSKPQPRDLLAYLMARVKNVTTETVEREAGVPDLGTILSGHRPPTSEEARLLSQYFAVSQDAFV
jgi:antitoxin component HigA of HigAB toxin-antitoxin module